FVTHLICYFFFFQAEDGIRDRNVTGVQTCALPIFNPEFAGSRKSATAVPSRMNSGLTHTPKSVPIRFPLLCSIVGTTTVSAVPGSTVLRNTIKWNEFFFLRASPISRQ